MTQAGHEAERLLNELLGSSLCLDFVLWSPQFDDRGTTKEVCDHVLEQSGQAIPIQLKTQDPAAERDGARERKWLRKHGGKAVRQLSGSISTLARRDIDVSHLRRGSFTIKAASLEVIHAVALVDSQQVAALGLPTTTSQGVPAHTLTVADFVWLANELMTVPDMFMYLDRRSETLGRLELPVGAEKALYAWYITHKNSFAELQDLPSAESAAVDLYVGDNQAFYEMKRQDDRLAKHYQDLIDGTHNVNPELNTEMPAELAAGWTWEQAERDYIRIAYELNAVPRAFRRETMRKFLHKCELAEGSWRPRFYSEYFSPRETVFVFASFDGEPQKAWTWLNGLARGAWAAIAERGYPVARVVVAMVPSRAGGDGAFRYLHLEPEGEPGPRDREAAAHLFGATFSQEVNEFPHLQARPGELRTFGPVPGEEVRAAAQQMKIGRNAPCPCGSGRKYKKCHGA